jgi:hypothetical protein
MASLRIAFSAVRIERVCSPTCHSFSISRPSEVTRITSSMPVEIALSVLDTFMDIVAHNMSLVVVPAHRLLRGLDALGVGKRIRRVGVFAVALPAAHKALSTKTTARSGGMFGNLPCQHTSGCLLHQVGIIG